MPGPAPRVVTITANPALDVTTTVPRLEPERKLRCHGSRIDPGGGGANVSRVVHRLGGGTTAIVALGGPTGEAYRRLLEAERVPTVVVPIAGDTRQNFAVHETATGEQFRFVLEGPSVSEAEWRRLPVAAAAALHPGDWLVVSGSLPPGMEPAAMAELVAAGRSAGASIAIDSSGPALRAALEAGPDLVKPSRRELADLVGRPLRDDDVRGAAQQVLDDFGIGAIAVTLAEQGALLVTPDETIRAPAVRVDAVSAVGSGDSFLAALVLRRAQGVPARDALRTAMAAGAATAMTVGTRLCSAADVERLERDALPFA